ncbi:co-chaperone GroES [Candidatus Uhrbacteria bacterium]|nr:co-chaperone GroES [Candidatus Uhrbacteria bacterium]
MRVKPLSDRVLVKPLAKSETTKSGIVIPDTVSKERPEQGEIVAVGPGKVQKDGSIRPIALKVGDRVMFKSYAPTEVKVDGEEMFVLEESDIIALLEE